MPDKHSEKLDRAALEKLAYEWREKQAALEAENADMKEALKIMGVTMNAE